LDELLVCIEVLRLQVLEVPLPLTDESEQAAPSLVIVLVELEMLGQLFDTLGLDSYLRFAGTNISLVLLR
jgi:hypothetical protein